MTISEEILLNITPQETRVAIVENGALQEVSIERQSSRGIVGNIYKGKVNRVLPGMEAAFFCTCRISIFASMPTSTPIPMPILIQITAVGR
jgi:ribonuclease G